MLTALAHGVSCAIIFRNILHGIYIMKFISLLHCLWCSKKMAISEKAETEMCFPSILLERRVRKKGGGRVVEKWKRSLVNALSQL